MITIELVNRRGVALVDDADAGLVGSYRWYRIKPRNVTYAVAYPEPSKPLYMHRLITGAGPGEKVDHHNGDGLDNQRANLRLATHQQNAANHGPISTNTSGYRGVHFSAARRTYGASIVVAGKTRWLGSFTDPWDAAQAYNEAAREAWGEFAHLNAQTARDGGVGCAGHAPSTPLA